jgi:hypothetical protein
MDHAHTEYKERSIDRNGIAELLVKKSGHLVRISWLKGRVVLQLFVITTAVVAVLLV